MERRASIAERYFEKPTRLKTWSGIPVKEIYTPDDVKDVDYERDLGDAGEYPYTRGIFPDMYRGRLWSLREICGYGSAGETNKRLKFLLSEGETALNVIADMPTQCGLDSDHPHAEGAVGVEGMPWCSLRDMEVMTEGIPIGQVSMTLSVVWLPVYAMYLVAAEKQGVPLDRVRGTFFADAYLYLLTRYLPASRPIKMGMREEVDLALFCNQYVPRVYYHNCGAEGLRESGATAAQEIATDLSVARAFIKEVVRKGGDANQVSRRCSFTQRCGIDIFEEAAKFRAARRIYAKMLREEFGVDDPRSLTYKVHVVTKGSDLFPQQPENNIIRIAYQALAAVLGGVQSMHTTAFDEPICLPTEESQRLAVRTQQILCYETGVANVADPLGGSYYVEWLTNKLEQEIMEIMDEIKENISELVERDELIHRFFKGAHEFQQEVENGERTIVGVNKFTIEEHQKREVKLHVVPEEAVREHLEHLRELRKWRSNSEVKKALDNVRRAVENEEENTVPAVIEAVKAYATLGEITGVERMAHGYDYDPFGELKYPFD